MSEAVELELHIKYDRELSIGIKHPNDPRGRTVFLPKKFVVFLSELHELPGRLTRFEIPEWLATREGLI